VLGTAYYSKGDYQQCINNYQDALRLAQESHDREDETVALKNLARIYSNLNDNRLSLEYLLRALKIAQELSDKRSIAVVLLDISTTYFSMGDYKNALDYGGQADELIKRVGDKNVEAQIANYNARIYKSLGDYNRAYQMFNEALGLTRLLHDPVGEGTTLADIADTYKAEGRCDKAMEMANQALPILRAGGIKPQEVSTLTILASCQRDSGALAEARKNIEAALDIVESIRTKFSNRELRAGYSSGRNYLYDLYADVLMRMHSASPGLGYDELALQASERGRARGLVELLREARVDLRRDADASLIEQERALKEKIDAKAASRRALAKAGASQDAKDNSQAEMDDLLAQYNQVQAQLRRSSPHYAALILPQPLTLKEIQERVVDKDTLLLEYSLGADRSYLWVVSDKSIASFTLAAREKIEPVATRLYESLTERSRRVRFETEEEKLARLERASAAYQIAATELSNLLLRPAGDILANKRLLIVADGALNYVPFAVLPMVSNDTMAARGTSAQGGRLLIEDHEVLNIPSASAIAQLRQELKERQAAPLSVAVIADPVFDRSDPRVQAARTEKASQLIASKAEQASVKGVNALRSALEDTGITGAEGQIPRLPYTRKEADAIARIGRATGVKELIDFKASRALVLSGELSRYRYVHFATHGLLNSAHPELSGVLLSMVDADGAEQNGFLTTHDVFDLKLPAEMVVLSACRTGLGKDVQGEGLIGLTRGFMYAGAARVMVSLWDVSDEATSELMARVYEGMLKRHLTPAAALREAQLSMSRDTRWKEPFFWAGFVLEGEPK
jgi:CHAT domain-containing protein